MLLLFAPGAPRETYIEGLVDIAQRAEELADFHERHDNPWV